MQKRLFLHQEHYALYMQILDTHRSIIVTAAESNLSVYHLLADSLKIADDQGWYINQIYQAKKG